MSITVLPATAFTSEERLDIGTLLNIITTLSNVLAGEARIPADDRLMDSDALTAINTSITDAADRLDSVINPAAPV